MRKSKINNAFNNEIEYGLRTLVILLNIFPSSCDINKLIYLDYLLVHSGDFNSNLKSLHAPVPYRKEEIYIRRDLINKGILLFAFKGLIKIIYSKNGIEYTVTEDAQPFVDDLNEEYTIKLFDRAKWISDNFIKYNLKMLINLVNESSESKKQDIAFSVEFIKE